MKRFICLFAVMAFSVIMSLSVFAENISIEIMGNILNTENEPEIVDSRTMLPVRAIFEGIGANVDWDGSSRTITGTMQSATVIMKIDSNVVSVNGIETTMDAAPVIINDRAYAPARYVAESFGYDVEWDAENRVVRIDKPNTGENTFSEIVTEAATETTSKSEDKAEPYEKYSEFYIGENLYAGRDIPAGDYVVLADNDDIGYISIYEYGKIDADTEAVETNQDDKYFGISDYFENSYVVRVKDKQYVSVESAALVPMEMVEKMDINQNGMFRVGVDIPAGHYTFKLDSSCNIGYVETKNLEDNVISSSNLSNIRGSRLYDGYTEVTMKLTNGTMLRKYGVDIYDTSLNVYADYSHKAQVYSTTDDEYKFSDVRAAFKEKIALEYIDQVRNYSNSSKKSERYKKTYINNQIKNWKSSAQNDAELKYVDILSEMYDRFFYFTYYSDNENFTNRGVNSASIISERDEYERFAIDFYNAQSFEECELASYNTRGLYYYIPIGQEKYAD